MLPGLGKEHIVATVTYSRWWTILAALCINLSIGQAYAFSVFNLPLTRVLGVSAPAPGDWPLTTLGWIFTLAYIFLGLSAGVAGRWQERVGPRVSGLLAAGCFGGGFFLSAAGVWLHEIWLLYLGYGVLGGCGLGIGFNTPIPVLLQWFPDRAGLATGVSVMGFGGGAIIAAPLSEALMARFATETSVGVAQSFLVLGSLYLALIACGALLFRVPPSGYRPGGGQQTSASFRPGEVMSVPVEQAVRTKQFYLLWMMLLLNVTAGLGVLAQAAAMVQEMFTGFSSSAAAVFVAVLSFFNMSGRLLWAWLSDTVGRRQTFAVFFVVGPMAYAMVPWAGATGNLMLFVACFAVILSMYGAGFALMPPYIAEVFGPAHVGAINGRVLTALSLAGICGPVAVNYLREAQIARGVSISETYDITLYAMALLLVGGFFCNRAVTPIPRPVPVLEEVRS
jgi:MFS family permease